jgi:predicted signal transduction protein with EAL and GGDEF domain
MVPVGVIMQPVEHSGRPHHAVAVRDLRARRQAERQIHFLAHHDALAGLANRVSFGKRLDLEIRAADADNRKLAVLCLDLDRFNEVNDLFGHSAGDAMLDAVSRTSASVPERGIERHHQRLSGTLRQRPFFKACHEGE